MKNKLWFRAKTYGWGWVPCSWEGWTVTGLYVAGVALFAGTLDEYSPAREIMFTFVLPVALLTSMLIRLAYKKGEKPSWRWGKKEGE